MSRDFEIFGGKADGFTHMAFIPVISNGEHWGVVTLFGKGHYIPGKLKVDLLEQFGEQLGAALVLGRRMRAVATSLKNTKALMCSLGDELYVTSKLSHTACPRRLQRIVRSCRLFFGEGLLQFLHVIQDPSLIEDWLFGSVETEEEEEVLSGRYPVRFHPFWCPVRRLQKDRALRQIGLS